MCVIASLLFVHDLKFWASHLGGSGPGCRRFSQVRILFTVVVLAYMDAVVCFEVPFHKVVRVYEMGCNLGVIGALGASGEGNSGVGRLGPLGKDLR